MQLTGSCYAFYALRKEQRVIPAKEKPPDCLVVAFFPLKEVILMKIIAVKKLFSNAFSEKNALILRSEIQKLLNTKEKILIDFEGISKYTTLFFNFSTGYFISLLGVEKYNEKISLKGLSSLGKRTYQNSYKNAIKSYPPEIQKEILNIISNPDD